ncbi:anti-sigma factor [Acetobacteraceae bacterium KSS8]|uniref:Anti-sigma factor n=1 Tax=Endosaccharibacter trunci TaxID=2812733 RepID=A0ABT1W7I3_9PROT|nr:anti-sigma factor [Acetobacteraceae bacterium KSS8]
MSDDSEFAHDRDARAGEYVLGLGDAMERLAFEREMARDAALAAAVAEWERRLRPWLNAFRPMSPPQALWERLSRSAFGLESVTAIPAHPKASGRLLAGAIGFALAAGIAFAVVLGQPSLLPSTTALPVAALLPKSAAAPVLVVLRDNQGGLLIRSIGALNAPAGKGYELWSLPAGATRPVALGMLVDGKARVQANAIPAGRGLILVSLEASGGSPTGLPQGPVLWSGAFAGAS